MKHQKPNLAPVPRTKRHVVGLLEFLAWVD